uniref:Peptidase aspartic putative domain-containing protein n=1 Tax=Amphimedon queenslandica TaxID=400682 RepID=A0A1X7V777_AMPQE
MLFSVPSICEPLSGSSIQLCLENYKHLQGLEPSDVSNLKGMVEPNVLIGFDCYWEFVSGDIMREIRGPTASHAKLGWVLSGPLERDENGQCSSILITHNLITSAEPKDSSPDLLKDYNTVIKDQLAWVIARVIVEIVEDPGVVDGEKFHYLPHNAVVRRDKTTTKVRVVLHASARTDIEKAFLMVSVVRKDRDVLRFLWIRNPDEEPPLPNPFLLNATVRHHVEHCRDSDPLVVKSLLESICVDDIIGGADTEEGYIASESVIDTGVIDKLYAKFSLGNSPERLTELKVLGIRWMVEEDALVFDIREVGELANVTGPTKGNAVQAVGRIYDPLGILTPITIHLKIFLQELHKSRIGWDQQLTGDLLERWRILVSKLRRSNPIEIQR